MTKLICKTWGSLLTKRYQTPTGNVYLFRRGIPTVVKVKKDVEFFLASDNFEKHGIVQQAVKAVKKVVAAEDPEEALDEEALYALNKKEQRALIKKIGGMNTRIPAREKDRVKLLLELQGNDKKEAE